VMVSAADASVDSANAAQNKNVRQDFIWQAGEENFLPV
jgi:hypothetical protein